MSDFLSVRESVDLFTCWGVKVVTRTKVTVTPWSKEGSGTRRVESLRNRPSEMGTTSQVETSLTDGQRNLNI